MKALLFSALVLAAVAPQAQAKEVVCGDLKAVTYGPKCLPGQMCPHYIKVVEILTQQNGLQLELQTKSAKVLKGLSALNGSKVCVSGNPINDGQFEVTAVRKAVSAN